MATLWNKGTSATEAVDRFTVGNDRVLDLRLARYDVQGSRAHIKMLEKIGLLSADELKALDDALARIAGRIEAGDFVLEPDVDPSPGNLSQLVDGILTHHRYLHRHTHFHAVHRHTHFHAVHRSFRYDFTPHGTLPYHFRYEIVSPTYCDGTIRITSIIGSISTGPAS